MANSIAREPRRQTLARFRFLPGRDKEIRAAACRTAAATAAAPSARAVAVSATRREMGWQSLLSVFMIAPSMTRSGSAHNR
jgi:hypothetical protein